MKIVHINKAPAISDADIHRIVTQIGAIGGRNSRNNDVLRARNDALRAYVFALRDRQRADAQYDIIGADESLTADDYNRALSAVQDDIVKAQDAVERTFEHLIICQFALNRS
jgi:hypothetical protein